MQKLLTIEDAVSQIALNIRPKSLIAIDGLPCAGKSTMAKELTRHINAECVQLDEFVFPKQEWLSKDKPSFPFEYIRYNSFLNSIKALATTGECSFYPFDWCTYTISNKIRTVTLSRPVIIEGVSSLNRVVCGFYNLRVFVESNRATTLQTAIDRGVGPWEKEWRNLFLPSVDLYMLTRPQNRADLLVAGRDIKCLDFIYNT